MSCAVSTTRERSSDEEGLGQNPDNEQVCLLKEQHQRDEDMTVLMTQMQALATLINAGSKSPGIGTPSTAPPNLI